ncbi:acyl carrier protein [Enterococcus faecium]|nr:MULTISPECIES: acyl carrier protein [Bacillota]MBJ0795874.1 acyl carrier protein [Enterococcus faecium]HES0992132.1 acyl carrier protein [Streptococcus pyogenes]MCC2716675.1 acyl carrier protein [Finegoldia magna]MDB8850152.1 acyl carrier protein [Peptostreptococcus anaerobius]MDB8854069.1 acyl carrier protein [Peptostreptococcus anaerobius]
MNKINNDSMEKFIKKQLSELLDMDIDNIKNDENLLDYGVNSMIIVQLYVCLQEEYRVHLEDKLDLYRNHISIEDIIREMKEGVKNHD